MVYRMVGFIKGRRSEVAERVGNGHETEEIVK